MKYLKFATALVVSTVLLGGSAYAKTFDFSGSLTGEQEVPQVQTAASGELNASYNTISKVLKWKISYSGLSGAPTMAHFHGPANATQNAPVIIPIKTDALPSPIEGSEKLTKQQEQQLLSGHWYFNIHTKMHPGGEIRTQLIAK